MGESNRKSDQALSTLISASRLYLRRLGPHKARPDLFLILQQIAEKEFAMKLQGAEASDLYFQLLSQDEQKLAKLTAKAKKRGAKKQKQAKYEMPPLVEEASLEANLSRAELMP